MLPAYTIDKIKFSTDKGTFEKAVALYEGGKVTQFKEGIRSYSAVVLGTQPYRVYLEARDFRLGGCDCYLGQREILCKHQVAVALHAVMGGKPLSEKESQLVSEVTCSGKLRELTEEEHTVVKKAITSAISYIKPYRGPSRLWFSYQSSLSEGCRRLAAVVSELPVSQQTATLLVKLLLRLEKKLQTGGVDDSDGTVGGFMQTVVVMLKEFARLDPACKQAFQELKGKETCFGWEESLL